MGLIFTKGDLKEVSEEVAKYKVHLIASIFSFRAFFCFCFSNYFHFYWIVRIDSL